VLKEDKQGKRQGRVERSRFWRDPKTNTWFYMGSDILDTPEQAVSPPEAETKLPSTGFKLPSLPNLKF
jgi:hypothetical protein